MRAVFRKASLITGITVMCSGPLALAQGNSEGRGLGELPSVVGKGSLTIAGKGYWHRQSLEDSAFHSHETFHVRFSPESYAANRRLNKSPRFPRTAGTHNMVRHSEFKQSSYQGSPPCYPHLICL